MQKLIFSFLLIFVLSFLSATAQKVENLTALKQKLVYDNIISQTINSDSTVTSTVVWIKKDVKPHYHANHSEQVIVIEGNGQMLLGSQILNVGPGDLIYIPKGTIHAVRVTSKDKPMKVLSIHSPQFDGSDRVQVEKSGW